MNFEDPLLSRSYKSPVDLRRALETRLADQAHRRGVDVNRLRHQVAFERILARLTRANGAYAAPRWVLKGGLLLELRFPDRARATRDMDMALAEAIDDGHHVRIQLIDALAEDTYGDYFSFTVSTPSPLQTDLAGRPGWRFTVDTRLAGKSFTKTRLDVVARPEEIAGAIQPFTIHSLMTFAGLPSKITISAVDVAQHAAEKFHALTRDYGDRLNARVKDLVDLVLMVEHDLLNDVQQLRDRLQHVFTTRGTHPLPDDLPTVPAAWHSDYIPFAADLELTAQTVDDAMALIRPLWLACVSSAHTREPD